MYGLPIGLINISGNGLFNPSIWTDDTGFTYAGMQFGAGALYTLVYGGVPNDSSWTAASLGVGMGLHMDLGRVHLDVDVSAKSYGTGGNFDEALRSSALGYYDFFEAGSESFDSGEILNVPVYPTARIHAGFTLFGSVAALAGVSFESLISPDQVHNDYFHRGDPWLVPVEGSNYTIKLFPRLFFGLRV